MFAKLNISAILNFWYAENRILTFHLFYLFQWNPFKSNEKCVLFHPKSSFRSQIFVLTFWSWKVGHWSLVKIRLISKFMKLQPSYQTITIYTLPNISRCESNKTIKFDQLLDYSKKNIFVQKSCRKWGTGTSSRPLFKKALYEVKTSVTRCNFSTFQ